MASDFRIRPLDPDGDARAVVALVRDVYPAAVINVAAWRHRHHTIPARGRHAAYVAELRGEIAGFTEASLNWFANDSDAALVGVTVGVAFRQRGIGVALWTKANEHVRELGSSRVLTQFPETEDAVRFASARGFRELRAEVMSSVDPTMLELKPSPGVDVRPVSDFAPEQIQLVDEAATLDMPSAEPFSPATRDEWLDRVWRHPLLTREGSFAAVFDGEPVAISLLLADGAGRAKNMFTGTLRAHRGQGLALATKIASLRWAADHAITQIFTANDEANAAMLAVNRRLGYTPFARSVEYGRSTREKA